MRFKMLAFSILLGTIVASCGKKSSGSSTAQGSMKLNMRTTGKAPTSLALAAAQTVFRNSAIASGAPSALTVYVTKMSLGGASGDKTIFYEAAGKPIRVGSTAIDISSLFTTYACVDSSGVPVTTITECPCGLDSDKKAIAKSSDGTCPDKGSGGVANVSTDEGTYTKISVEFQVRAKVKGCATGNFTTVSSNGTDTQGSRTYCTKASASTFSATPGVGLASDLEGTLAAAQEMDYQLPKANELYTDPTKTFTMDFPIKDSVTISSSATTTPTLTMMIDPNRMLRFYNQNVTTNPNPGMSSTRSYFFNTVFEESSFVFVGTPGDIRGFQWWTEACANNTTGATCSGSTTIVSGWMTVIKDSAGKPLVVGVMPDDDNALTIIKGSNKSSAGIDQAAFTASGSNYDIKYTLSGSTGSLKGINLDAAVSSTQTASFTGLQSYGGILYLMRGL